jgi:spermidine/putrescine transport system ATP-binding protein
VNHHPHAVETENLVRRFGDVAALAGVSLNIRRGEFFSLLGPSGCGKTTLLRIIAGLDVPDEGIVRIGNVDARDLPAHRRPVNTVFQSYALFPHMTVWDNIAFGLRMKKVPKPTIQERVARVMDLVQIAPLAHRKPAQLSGGQKQRVALARAVVNEPEVLLLDEPLGALDLKLRKELQVELLALQRRLGITFIYVTHDQEEALVMSDRIAVMQAGKIEQMDDAEALYERPRTRFVAQFLGSCNLLPGDGRTLAIRPEKIALLPATEPTDAHRVRARIEEVIYVGAETHYMVQAGAQRLRVEAMNTKVGHQGFDVGQEVVAHLPPEALLPLED